MEVLFIAAVLYLIPTITAQAREQKDVGSIFALNRWLGWTFLEWVIALVWALKN